MKHFVNAELLAPNVMTVPLDEAIVAEFANDDFRTLPGFESRYPKWQSDMEWCSPSTPETHEIFESAFARLKIADHVRPYLDIDREVRLYAGFLVIRSVCKEAHFHVDWVKTNNEAFTLLTPVTRNAGQFGLLYRKMTGEVAAYEYRFGEAIIFGDYFMHSTRPGRSDEPVVLLCFEFGTDKMEHWDKIFATVGKQTAMVRKPDGQFMETDEADRAAAGARGGYG